MFCVRQLLFHVFVGFNIINLIFADQCIRYEFHENAVQQEGNAEMLINDCRTKNSKVTGYNSVLLSLYGPPMVNITFNCCSSLPCKHDLQCPFNFNCQRGRCLVADCSLRDEIEVVEEENVECLIDDDCFFRIPGDRKHWRCLTPNSTCSEPGTCMGKCKRCPASFHIFDDPTNNNSLEFSLYNAPASHAHTVNHESHENALPDLSSILSARELLETIGLSTIVVPPENSTTASPTVINGTRSAAVNSSIITTNSTSSTNLASMTPSSTFTSVSTSTTPTITNAITSAPSTTTSTTISPFSSSSSTTAIITSSSTTTTTTTAAPVSITSNILHTESSTSGRNTLFNRRGTGRVANRTISPLIGSSVSLNPTLSTVHARDANVSTHLDTPSHAPHSSSTSSTTGAPNSESTENADSSSFTSASASASTSTSTSPSHLATSDPNNSISGNSIEEVANGPSANPSNLFYTANTWAGLSSPASEDVAIGVASHSVSTAAPIAVSTRRPVRPSSRSNSARPSNRLRYASITVAPSAAIRSTNEQPASVTSAPSETIGTIPSAHSTSNTRTRVRNSNRIHHNHRPVLTVESVISTESPYTARSNRWSVTSSSSDPSTSLTNGEPIQPDVTIANNAIDALPVSNGNTFTSVSLTNPTIVRTSSRSNVARAARPPRSRAASTVTRTRSMVSAYVPELTNVDPMNPATHYDSNTVTYSQPTYGSSRVYTAPPTYVHSTNVRVSNSPGIPIVRRTNRVTRRRTYQPRYVVRPVA